MDRTIYISGTGIISPVGNNTEQCLTSLKNKKSGIEPISFLYTDYRGKMVAGEVKHTNNELIQMLNKKYNEYYKYTRTTLLAMIAAQEAVRNSGIDINKEQKTGFISATTVGGMDKTENEYFKNDQHVDFILTHPSGDSTEKVAEFLKIKDYRTTVSTACSSSANSIMHAARLIKNGFIDRAIAGGTDALSKFTLNGFLSLMILDKELCKPFDENRQGLNLGEGAAFLVLESEESMKKGNREPLCCLTGYSNANDAYHQTASSPEGEGAYLAMKKALEISGCSPSDIDYINSHGTGTLNNDLSEGVAIKKIFEDKIPKFSSTKSYTGHTLGAAAGIEAVFSVLSLVNGYIFPNLNYKETIKELGIIPETKFTKGNNIKNILSNSFGFGGNNSSLVFSKV